MHDPRPGRLVAILTGVDGAEAGISLRRKLGAEGVGFGLRGEGTGAHQVAQGPALGIVGRPLGDLHYAGLVAVGR